MDPSDVLQQAFIEISRRVDRYLVRPSIPFYLWLRRITLYALRDIHRFHLQAQVRDARKDVAMPDLDDPVATSTAMAAHLVKAEDARKRSAGHEEKHSRIEEALNRLEHRDREILALRFFEQLSNVEAAKILSLSAEACRKRYFRALVRFREEYGEPFAGEA